MRRHAEKRRARVEMQCNRAIEQPVQERLNCRIALDHITGDPPQARRLAELLVDFRVPLMNPRQQLIDLGVAMTGDQRLDRGLHVGERLNAIELAGGDERGQASPVLGSFVVACEQ